MNQFKENFKYRCYTDRAKISKVVFTELKFRKTLLTSWKEWGWGGGSLSLCCVPHTGSSEVRDGRVFWCSRDGLLPSSCPHCMVSPKVSSPARDRISQFTAV